MDLMTGHRAVLCAGLKMSDVTPDKNSTQSRSGRDTECFWVWCFTMVMDVFMVWPFVFITLKHCTVRLQNKYEWISLYQPVIIFVSFISKHYYENYVSESERSREDFSQGCIYKKVWAKENFISFCCSRWVRSECHCLTKKLRMRKK